MNKLNVNIAKLATAAMLANGTIEKAELEVCKNLAEDLEVNWVDFEKVINDEKGLISKLSEEKFDEYIENIAKEISEDDAPFAFEAVTHVLLADGILEEDEAVVLSVLADALTLPSSDIIFTLSHKFASTPNFKVQFGE